MSEISRRDWLKDVAAAGASAAFVAPQTPAPTPANGTVAARTSTSDIFVPPRGRSFQKFSFDFPEPSVAFDGYEFGFRIFTHENVYGLLADAMRVRPVDGGFTVDCSELTWAGGQQRARGRLSARLSSTAAGVTCVVNAEMGQPIKAVALVVRGIPRGRISTGGAFFDPRDDEVLLGYPFQGGDLFGPQSNGGLTTPLVIV